MRADKSYRKIYFVVHLDNTADMSGPVVPFRIGHQIDYIPGVVLCTPYDELKDLIFLEKEKKFISLSEHRWRLFFGWTLLVGTVIGLLLRLYYGHNLPH